MKKGTFNIATHQEPFRVEHTAYKAVAEVYDTEIPILIYKPIGAHGKPYGHWEVVEYYTGKPIPVHHPYQGHPNNRQESIERASVKLRALPQANIEALKNIVTNNGMILNEQHLIINQ